MHGEDEDIGMLRRLVQSGASTPCRHHVPEPATSERVSLGWKWQRNHTRSLNHQACHVDDDTFGNEIDGRTPDGTSTIEWFSRFKSPLVRYARFSSPMGPHGGQTYMLFLCLLLCPLPEISHGGSNGLQDHQAPRYSQIRRCLGKPMHLLDHLIRLLPLPP